MLKGFDWIKYYRILLKLKYGITAEISAVFIFDAYSYAQKTPRQPPIDKQRGII